MSERICPATNTTCTAIECQGNPQCTQIVEEIATQVYLKSEYPDFDEWWKKVWEEQFLLLPSGSPIINRDMLFLYYKSVFPYN